MKKLILMVSLGIAATIYQPAKAQVSFNLQVGPQPTYYPASYYAPTYYVAPPTRNIYYAPVKYYKAPKYAKRTVVYHTPSYAPQRVYRSNYYSKKQYYKAPKHLKYKKNDNRGRHKGRH